MPTVDVPFPSLPQPLAQPPAQPADPFLEHALQEKVVSIGFHAFCQMIATLLTRMGYENVRPTGRTHWRGSNQHRVEAGYDLVAEIHFGGLRRIVLVSLKQFLPERPIYRRTIDELRGVCLRTNASEAILITTAAFSPSVAPSVRRPLAGVVAGPIAPVSLVDGDTLVALLIRHRVGVTQSAGGSHVVLDAAAFREWDSQSSGNAPMAATNATIATTKMIATRHGASRDSRSTRSTRSTTSATTSLCMAGTAAEPPCAHPVEPVERDGVQDFQAEPQPQYRVIVSLEPILKRPAKAKRKPIRKGTRPTRKTINTNTNTTAKAPIP